MVIKYIYSTVQTPTNKLRILVFYVAILWRNLLYLFYSKIIEEIHKWSKKILSGVKNN